MFTYPPLTCLLEVVGADRVMFSVDYPYSSNAEGREFVLGAPISEADREKVGFANAARLLGLGVLNLSGSSPREATTAGG